MKIQVFKLNKHWVCAYGSKLVYRRTWEAAFQVALNQVKFGNPER